ncbi:MAG TPA: hypothetical protein VE957_18035 [Terriglobales bacterium]|nr:hypothetical protein [Terriglobales bacterium]
MKARLVIIALVILQSISAQTKSPKGTVNSDRPPALSKEFQTAGQLALEAIKRLDEAGEEPSVSYEPRRLDAEKAVSEGKRKAKTAEDKHVADVLNHFLQGLLTARQTWGPDKLGKGEEKYWETTIFPCAVEAGWYFGDTLTKEGIETAKKSTCAPNSNPK